MNALLSETSVCTFESLATAEAAISRHQSTYQEAAQALIDIREGELWREGEYRSWEEYLKQKWDFTPGRASQLESAGRFVRYLVVNHPGEPIPESERVVRELNQIRPKRNRERPWNDLETEDQVLERRALAWRQTQDAAESNGVEVTSTLAKLVVDKHFRGGNKIKPKGRDEAKRLSTAFMAIGESQLFPDKAAKLMTESDWRRFDLALDFMKRMDRARK